jgi:iron(III) transport system substrate-binding protein
MRKLIGLLLILSFMIFVACDNGADIEDPVKEVVVYTAVDQNYAEMVLAKFTADTGIVVRPVFDVEASKTTGLINRLISEKDSPTADVFWNNEISQTLLLEKEGVLASYSSISASDIPDNYKDPDGYWTAFGGRARCFIINTELVKEEDYPTHLSDMFSDKYDPAQIALARPLFGTTLTQASALYAHWGDQAGREFFNDIVDHGISIVEGNSVVKDMVAEGRMHWGLTDTDDAIVAMEAGYPVIVLIPDQEPGDMGTLVIPNSVGMINGAPNEEAAKAFIDWLLLPEQEKYLIDIHWTQVAVRDVGADSLIPIDNLITMPVTFDDIFDGLQKAENDLRELFLN